MTEKPLILIVDDNIAILSLCKNTLEANYFRILTALNAEDGLNLYRQQYNYIDAVILDLHLSDRSYINLVNTFMAINQEVKIIGLSESINSQELPENFQAIIFAILKKPFTVKDLLNAVNSVIHKPIN